jgi:hypothetical protein
MQNTTIFTAWFKISIKRGSYSLAGFGTSDDETWVMLQKLENILQQISTCSVLIPDFFHTQGHNLIL